MPKPLKLELNEGQRQELEAVRDRDPRAYLRERAGALLKIAAGQSGRSVARMGLLRARYPEAVYRWYKRYQADGIQGLAITPGAGRKPCFSPTYSDRHTAQERMLHIIRRAPEQYGLKQTRWTLAALGKACQDWLRVSSVPGLCQVLKRLKIHWKHARQYVHSPDPDYVAKLRSIKINVLAVAHSQQVLLFEDEFTLYRQPGLAFAYEQQGKRQPLARLGHKGNYTWRIAAALNPWTGQVVYHQARVMDVQRMIAFYRKLAKAYPGQEILLVQDNWSVHYHPDLLAALSPQELPYGNYAPPNWSHNPSNPILKQPLPIRLLFLPTYASWTNPIEKLWRFLKQELLHLHRYEDRWLDLKQKVWQFLDQFALGSPDLLRYVGLSNPALLYKALFPPLSPL